MTSLDLLPRGLTGYKQGVSLGCGLTIRPNLGRVCFQVYMVVGNIQVLQAAGQNGFSVFLAPGCPEFLDTWPSPYGSSQHATCFFKVMGESLHTGWCYNLM